MTLIRPTFLLLFIIWLPLCYWLIKNLSHQGQWQKVIDPSLFKALSSNQVSKNYGTSFLVPTVGCLIIIALAGPAIETNEAQSAHQGNLFVILDNSLSMAAEDISPDRITRAKRIIADWANSGLFDKTSVTLYSGSAHTLTPLTRDVNTLNVQLAPVTPFIMPAMGNHPELAMQKTKEQIENMGITDAHLLWITDDIAKASVSKLKSNIPNAISKTIIAIGTAEGKPIPLPNDQGFLTQEGKIVIVPMNEVQISDIAKSIGFKVLPLNSSPSPQLLENIEARTSDQRGYKDLGFWLLIPIAAILLWVARRQASIAIMPLLLITLNLAAMPKQANANDLFLNKDQKAYQALINNNPDRAIELSDNQSIMAQALFDQQQYQKSADEFLLIENQDALYNAGNALAHAGKLEEAIDAYDQALAMGEHKLAKKNKSLIEDYLKQQESSEQNRKEESDEKQQQQQQQQQQQNSPEQNSKQDPSDEQSSGGQEKEDAEKNKKSEQQEKGSENQEKPKQAKDHTDKNAEVLTPEQLREEQQVEAILNQLQPENSALLQNKFNYQYQKNPTESDGTLW